jgi:hypothetical protein
MTKVLAAVLDNHHDDLAQGRFPDRALLEEMNGSQIDPIDQDQLKRSDPVNFERQLTVLSLWGSPTRPARLPDALYRAFSITPPILPDGTEAVDDDDGGRGKPPPVTPHTRDRVVDTIRRWGGGGPMPPDEANLLRDCVYDSVLAHIDWDQLGLQRSVFASQARITFARANVHFARQTTRIPTDGTRLGIPLENSEDDLRQASITLEGLYLYRQHRNWNFPLGQQMFLRVADDLERWSQYVVGQLLALPVPRTAWDPAVAAVEVLAVGAALAGRPITQESSLVERVNALFEPWPEKPAAGSKEWRALHDLIRRRRALVIKMLRAHASGMKGGVARSFLDPNQIVPALLRIRRSWQPARPAPTVQMIGESWRRCTPRCSRGWQRQHRLSMSAVSSGSRRCASIWPPKLGAPSWSLPWRLPSTCPSMLASGMTAGLERPTTMRCRSFRRRRWIRLSATPYPSRGWCRCGR